MNEIARLLGADDTRPSRALNQAGRKLHEETRLAGMVIDSEAAKTAKMMERVADVDTYRRSLAGADQALNAALAELEMGFINKMISMQRGL